METAEGAYALNRAAELQDGAKLLYRNIDFNTFGTLNVQEILAVLADEGFEYLDGPVKRLAGPDVPGVPFSPPMQEFFMPNPDTIAAAIRELAAY